MSLWTLVKRTVAAVTGGGGAPQRRDRDTVDKGLLVFHNTSEVIRAEKILRESGLTVEVMGPPPDLRSGCDMVLVFPLVSGLVALQTLEKAGLPPLQTLPLCDLLLEPVSLFHSTWFGPYLMVRAANMKITVQLETSGDGEPCAARIVNVSGGGCPDVPYLAALMVGKTLAQADEPRVHGRTLCSYSLQKAFEETRRVTATLTECPQTAEDRAEVAKTLETAEATATTESPLPPGKPDTRVNSERRPRPWLVCGTVPEADFPLTLAQCSLHDEMLRLESAAGVVEIPVRRGTPALLASAVNACAALGIAAPQALLVGDEGSGEGSRQLYRELSTLLREQAQGQALWSGLTFHYLFPDVDGHNHVLMAIDELEEAGQRPLLVADAGFMYAAKMSGYAEAYDLFTPDAGELAFLADENAPHPFYTRGFLLASERDVPELARKAHQHGNSARYLLIKGAKDCVAQNGEILAAVETPSVPAMEPIGGTGDFVTGMVTAFLAGGYTMQEACLGAARANRYTGAAARPAPDTQVAELLPFVARAVQDAARQSV